MSDERSTIPAGELGRWFLVVLLILTGVVLYFRYAPTARQIVAPVVQDAAP